MDENKGSKQPQGREGHGVKTLLARSLDHVVVHRPSPARAHGVALLCVGLATLLRMALDPFVANAVPFATFYPAILIATLIGGAAAGLSSWALSSVAVWYCIFPPTFKFTWLEISEATSLGLFGLTSLPVVLVAHRLRRVVAALQQSEDRFRSLVEATPQLVWATRADGSVDYLSRQWVAFTGVPAERHYGAGWLEALHPDDRERVRVAWEGALTGAADYDVEYRLRRFDGGYGWFKVRGVPLCDAAGHPLRWIGTCTEITEIQEARQALARSHDDLERLVAERTRELAESNRLLIAEIAERERAEAALARAQRLEAIGQLTGGVAHDFNNLLTVIVGNLDMMDRAVGDPERVRRLASAALAAAGRGERLTQQLLAFARRQPLRPEVVGVNRLLRDLEPLLRRAVGEALEVTLDLDEDLRPCRVDPGQFEAAVLNLAVNARDATPAGGRITVSTRGLTLPAPDSDAPEELAPGDWLMIAVRDTGSGIPADVLPRVFDPFFTTKDVGKGSGLGLSQVYGFVNQSGGQVRIDSPPGAGTTVQIWLPSAAGAEEPAAALRPAVPAGGLAGNGETVLVVEDDADVRAVAVETLQALGYRVVTAADGVEAVETLKGGHAIDLLFTDVVMPRGINGAELARHAQELRPGLRVLLASGYTAQALTSEHGVVHGFPLLRKPYRGAELAREVRAALGAPVRVPAIPTSTAAEPLRVFIVEDDELIRLSTLELLTDIGAQVVGEAADAEMALARLEGRSDVDLLFTDMRLPGMSGADLTRELRRRRPSLPVVLATGYGDMVEGFDGAAPGNAILAKPYGTVELRRVLDRLRAREKAD
jgi:PAS domain S-box-containing protein